MAFRRGIADVTKPGVMRCFALRRSDLKSTKAIAPNATPSGLGPSDLTSAYKLGSGGSGATVAIVDAYDDPKAESDLAAYRSQYGLSTCTTANGCFKKVNVSGQTSPLPTADTGGWRVAGAGSGVSCWSGCSCRWSPRRPGRG